MVRSTTLAMTAVGLALGGLGYAALAFSQTPPAGASPRFLTTPLLLSQPISDQTPNADQVRRGQYLVRVGDCAACHTPDGGPPFAGSFALKTPFGVIYSTNLTSDPETGVGRITPDQFYAVMHRGVGPKGGQVYPAMPYNYFTQVTRADSDAILAYLRTTPPMRSTRPGNRLWFPLNFRFMVKGWNLLFFREATFAPDPTKTAEWNRGAYLVNGLGHCGACHTPKNLLAADKSGQAFRGGKLDNWVAPDLTANTRTGLGSWSSDDVVEYLKTGRNIHANAGGAMAAVVTDSTSLMTDDDLHAIAVYLKGQPPSPTRSVGKPDPAAMRRGQAIYSDACTACHMEEGVGQPRFFAPLAGNALVQQSDPTSLEHVILGGSRTAPTATRPTALSMPSFAWKLNDQQIADVSTYVRNSWGNQAPQVSAGSVAGLRKRLGLTTVHLTDNSGDHVSATAQSAKPGQASHAP